MNGVVVAVPTSQVKGGPPIPSLLIDVTLHGGQDPDGSRMAIEGRTVDGV